MVKLPTQSAILILKTTGEVHTGIKQKWARVPQDIRALKYWKRTKQNHRTKLDCLTDLYAVSTYLRYCLPMVSRWSQLCRDMKLERISRNNFMQSVVISKNKTAIATAQPNKQTINVLCVSQLLYNPINNGLIKLLQGIRWQLLRAEK